MRAKSEPNASQRKHGREVALPDFRAKIDLLLPIQPGRERLAETAPYDRQADVAKAMGMHPTDLARSIAGEHLSTAKVPAFLQLFQLAVDNWVIPESTADQAWLTLAREPLDAFRARVKLLGGEDFAGPGGETWDGFLDVLRRQGRHAPPQPECFSILAKDRVDWQSAGLAQGTSRMGPPGEAAWVGSHAHDRPLLRAGHLAKVFLDTRAALQRRSAHSLGAWVFLFQDVTINRRRRIAALVPFPLGHRLVMPSEFLEGGALGNPVLEVPTARGPEQFLEIYPEWGPDRSLIAVVTDHALDEEILCEARTHRELQIERLDLLAARLGDAAKWREGSFAVWEYRYQVI